MAMKRGFTATVYPPGVGYSSMPSDTGQRVEWPQGSGVFENIKTDGMGLFWIDNMVDKIILQTDVDGYMWLNVNGDFHGPLVKEPKNGWFVMSPPKQENLFVDGFLDALKAL